MLYHNDRVRDWYPTGAITGEDAAGWYAASGGLVPEPEPGEDRARSKKRRRTRIIAVVLCAALLFSAAGTVLARALRSVRVTTARSPSASSSQTAPSGGADDYREYFASVYTSSSAVSVPRAPAAEGVSLALYPAAGEELSLQEIYATVNPAVVGVIALRNGAEYSWGSGVVFTPDGYIVTNTHILAGTDGARVAFTDGTTYDALLVGADSTNDIAVLKVDGAGLPCAVFGDSDELRVGDPVSAIGNPLGPNYAGTMTNGIVSGIDRAVMKQGHTMTLIQTNAALNGGSSGGALVNACGQVVGITNMKILTSLYTTVEGIGFAIPSSVVRDVVNELLESGVVSGHPTIGITAGAVSDEAAELYGVPRGVYVSAVNPASASGLEEGDIILEADGAAVSTVAGLNAVKESFSVGDKLVLKVWRDGSILTLVCVLIDEADLE